MAPAGSSKAAGKVRKAWQAEAELIALFAESWGWDSKQLDDTEARKVNYLSELALAQRAVWIQDVSLAIYGGDQCQDRLRNLTSSFVQEETGDNSNLRKIADDASLPLSTRKAMNKRLEFIEFCKRNGVKNG